MEKNAINADMENTINDISMAVNEIDIGAGYLAQTADDMAEVCTAQAAQVSDVMLMVSQLQEDISYNEKDAEEAVKSSALAASTLVMAGEAMKELDLAMDEINDCAGQIGMVSDSVSEIGSELEKLSEDILTKAALSGEDDKALIVVANKIKQLADTSFGVSGSMEGFILRTANAVENGKRIVKEAADCMDDAQLGTEEASMRISTIKDNLKAEVESINNTSESICVIAGAVDNNSAMAEETAAAGASLKMQAETLVDFMVGFTF